MPTTRPWLALAALCASVTACSSRPITDDLIDSATGSGSSATETGASGSTVTAATTSATTSASTSGASSESSSGSSGPSTATATATSASTTSSSTTSSSSSSTTAPSFCGDGTCDFDFGEDGCNCPSDCFWCALPAPVTWGCPRGWLGGSSVVGAPTFGPFVGSTAFFAWEGMGDTSWSALRLFFLDASVDVEAAKQPWPDEHFVLRFNTPWDYADWQSTGELVGYYAREWATQDVSALVEITGRAGNWEVSDPNDPPRLLGWIYGVDDDPSAPHGPFDAAFCDAFVSQIIPE